MAAITISQLALGKKALGQHARQSPQSWPQEQYANWPVSLLEPDECWPNLPLDIPLTLQQRSHPGTFSSAAIGSVANDHRKTIEGPSKDPCLSGWLPKAENDAAASQ
jgi:hypothetical protein